MASPFQQQAMQRKFVYGACILVLFTSAWAWRRYSIDPQAFALAIREQYRGEVELVGAVIRQSLVGSRGLVTCYLNMQMQNQMKRNQWNELEISARALGKLQPHYVQPWLFQSWNLSYNVSVEADRVSDKYYFITRGIQYLAEGEQRNHFDPDLRWHMGFFLQHKVCQSDDSNTLRSLLQLSSIPPNRRDPARFQVMRNGRMEINMVEFEKFCQEHPHLVRRLKDGVMRMNLNDMRRQFTCDKPEAVVKFLEDNYRVPSLYEDVRRALVGAWQEKDDKPKANPLDRFPVLPPPVKTWTRVPLSLDIRDDVLDFKRPEEVRDSDDGHSIARGWFLYALEPVPDPGPMPGSTLPVTDRRYQRRPRRMMTVLFRQYPCIAQQFVADTFQEEGWFDNSGWEIHDWFEGDRFSDGKVARVGTERSWSEDAWKRGLDYWLRHGTENHIRFQDPAEEHNIRVKAAEFLDKSKGLPTAVRPEALDPAMRDLYDAYQFLKEYDMMRHTSNYPHHYNQALVESTPQAIQAKKKFHEAKRLYYQEKPQGALEAYDHPDGLRGWKPVLLANREYREDSLTQEATFEVQLRYFRVLARCFGAEYQDSVVSQQAREYQSRQVARLTLLPVTTGGGVAPAGLALWLSPVIKDTWNNPVFGGPFDSTDEFGVPLVTPPIRHLMYGRLYPNLRLPTNSNTPPPVKPPPSVAPIPVKPER
jgi:hypothetical protein